MPIPFDTTRYSSRLSAAGVPQEQAEAHASALAEVLNETPVALDADLALLKADILARVQEMLDALERRMQMQLDKINRRLDVMQTAIIVLATVEIFHLGITMVLLAKLL
jgi:transcription termination factor NusB